MMTTSTVAIVTAVTAAFTALAGWLRERRKPDVDAATAAETLTRIATEQTKGLAERLAKVEGEHDVTKIRVGRLERRLDIAIGHIDRLVIWSDGLGLDHHIIATRPVEPRDLREPLN